MGDNGKKWVYLASMWVYDMDVRVSEYTAPAIEEGDHCVRAGGFRAGLWREEKRGTGATSTMKDRGGYSARPDVQDIRRFIPQTRSTGRAHLDRSSEGVR